jgi:hypothetical protein
MKPELFRKWKDWRSLAYTQKQHVDLLRPDCRHHPWVGVFVTLICRSLSTLHWEATWNLQFFLHLTKAYLVLQRHPIWRQRNGDRTS